MFFSFELYLLISQAYNNALSSKNEADKAEFFYNLRNGKYGSFAKYGHGFVEYVGTTLGNVGSIVGNVLDGAKGKYYICIIIKIILL